MPTVTPVHILVIEDTPEALGSLVSVLRATDWRVSVATNGKQGFHRAQALAPDLVLLDVYMSGMDGFATCRLLKASQRTHDIPVIFLTSADGQDERLAGLEQGAVDYITKPCLPAEVVARVRIHVRLSQRASMPLSTQPMPLLSQGEVILRAAMQLIRTNLDELPLLDEVAHQVGTHDKKLSAIFREHLGMTVFAWVREERLRVAREWLANSHMSIQDVALQVGFHSAANFATAFRKRVGATPTQYRAQSARQQSASGRSCALRPGAG